MTAGAMKEDRNSSSTIAIGNNGGGAIGQWEGGAIVMAIAMNGGGGNGRRQWQWHNCNGQWQQQWNGWRDSSTIMMVMGNGQEKAAQHDGRQQ